VCAASSALVAAQPSIAQKILAQKSFRNRRPRPNPPPQNLNSTKTKSLATSGAGTLACALATSHQPHAQLTLAPPVEPNANLFATNKKASRE
jgi:hypothetical protein